MKKFINGTSIDRIRVESEDIQEIIDAIIEEARGSLERGAEEVIIKTAHPTFHMLTEVKIHAKSVTSSWTTDIDVFDVEE